MDEIRNCHYCGGKPTQSTFRDINWIGEQGYKSVIRCSMCHNQVEMWGLSHNIANEKAVHFWNGEKNNG